MDEAAGDGPGDVSIIEIGVDGLKDEAYGLRGFGGVKDGVGGTLEISNVPCGTSLDIKELGSVTRGLPKSVPVAGELMLILAV